MAFFEVLAPVNTAFPLLVLVAHDHLSLFVLRFLRIVVDVSEAATMTLQGAVTQL